VKCESFFFYMDTQFALNSEIGSVGKVIVLLKNFKPFNNQSNHSIFN
jgi:hypothetical protein